MKTSLMFVLAISLLGIAWNQQEELLVEDPRPVAAAIRFLEKKYDWRIIYEDPPYTDPRDLVDRTHPSRGSWQAVDPRGGRLQIHYSVLPATGKPDPESVLNAILEDHVRRGNPGRFQVQSVGTMYSVIPTQGSILDVPITFLQRERTYHEAIQEIIEAVSKLIQTPIMLGGQMYQPRRESFSIGANQEPAKQVLLRLFAEMNRHGSSWHLLFAPKWGYVLNPSLASLADQGNPPKKVVMKEVDLPDGTRGIIPVVVP